jgi:hypothetical protein
VSTSRGILDPRRGIQAARVGDKPKDRLEWEDAAARRRETAPNVTAEEDAQEPTG